MDAAVAGATVPAFTAMPGKRSNAVVGGKTIPHLLSQKPSIRMMSPIIRAVEVVVVPNMSIHRPNR